MLVNIYTTSTIFSGSFLWTMYDCWCSLFLLCMNVLASKLCCDVLCWPHFLFLLKRETDLTNTFDWQACAVWPQCIALWHVETTNYDAIVIICQDSTCSVPTVWNNYIKILRMWQMVMQLFTNNHTTWTQRIYPPDTLEETELQWRGWGTLKCWLD